MIHTSEIHDLNFVTFRALLRRLSRYSIGEKLRLSHSDGYKLFMHSIT